MSEVAMKTKEKNTNAAVRRGKPSGKRDNRTEISTQFKERMEESTARLDASVFTRRKHSEIGPPQERHLPSGLGQVVQQKLGGVRANGMLTGQENRADGSGTNKAAGLYQVGAYQAIKGKKGLDAHRAGQKAPMQKLVKNYDPNTGPAINVPKEGHTILGPNGMVSRCTKGITSAKQLLQRDVSELKRVYPDIPNTAVTQLVDMNKRMYPEMR